MPAARPARRALRGTAHGLPGHAVSRKRRRPLPLTVPAQGKASQERQKGAINEMLSAKISNEVRKKVYRREGYRCALCDGTQYLQVHHVIPRGQGGSSNMDNLICLCSRCHAGAHGIDLISEPGYERDRYELMADVEQACVEYLSDIYCEQYYPFR